MSLTSEEQHGSQEHWSVSWVVYVMGGLRSVADGGGSRKCESGGEMRVLTAQSRDRPQAVGL